MFKQKPGLLQFIYPLRFNIKKNSGARSMG